MSRAKLMTDAIDAFVVGCKADGIWDAIKSCCILAGWDGLAGALTPIKGAAPTNVNFVAGDYNRKMGLVGDATSKYLASNRAGNADPQNDSHVSVFIHTADATVNRSYFRTNLKIAVGGGAVTYSGINFTSLATHANMTSQSFFGLSRAASDSYTRRLNGASASVTDTSVAPSSAGLDFYRRETNTQFSAARLAFYSIGSSIDLALLDTRVSTLLTSIWRAVHPEFTVVTNPDAMDWIGRVYDAGGSVSTSTANVVNTFCNAIDAAGIRSKFLRLGIFAGNDLTSALVPLYRSSAYGGAVVGNATDTNSGFIAANYAETGASGGLTSDANKYLNTGVQPFASGSAIASEGHLSFWAMTQPPSRQSIIGARKDTATAAFGSAQLDNTGKGWFGWDTSTSLSGVTVGSAPLFGVVTRRSDGKTYMEGNGVAVANATSTAAGTTTASFGVFGHILDTGGVGLAALRMAGYSVGSALSASEGASLYSAWRTLQQSLGRL